MVNLRILRQKEKDKENKKGRKRENPALNSQRGLLLVRKLRSPGRLEEC